MSRRRQIPYRVSTSGKHLCADLSTARKCVRDPGHSGLHRSYKTRRNMRYFWDDEGREVRVITEEEWQEEQVNDAIRILRTTLAAMAADDS